MHPPGNDPRLSSLGRVKLLIWVVANTLALAAAAWILDGISFAGADWQEKLLPAILVAVILSVVSLYLAPTLKLLSIPFVILTLGLFLLVINALMLLLTGWVADQFDIGFRVDGFWNALFGSIIISIVGALARSLLPEEDR